MDFVGFEEPILAMTPAMQIEPILWADGKKNFLGDVSRKSEPEMNGMLEALLKSGQGTLEETGGEILFVGSGAGVFSVKFDGGAGGRGNDFERFGGCGRRKTKDKIEGDTIPEK